LPSGKLFETPAVPTLVDLPKYTQIYPDFATMSKYLNPIPNYEKNVNSTANFEGFRNDFIKVIKENKAVQNVSMNLDEKGIFFITDKNKNRIKYINNKIKI
jgi:hypothetical protein